MNNKKICAIMFSIMFLSGFFAIARAESNEPTEYDQPHPVPLDDRWGNDVRIGNVDSIYEVELDIHRQTGHLFSLLLFSSGVATHSYVLFSSDGGLNWTYSDAIGGNYHINSVTGAVLKNHFYFAYTFGSDNRLIRLRRYRASDGANENFNNGQEVINILDNTPGDSIREIVLVSDQDFLNRYMNLFAITKNGSLRYFYSDTAGVNWYEVSTGVTNASRGLDACTNEGYSNYYAFASYIKNNDYLQIDGFDYYGNRTGLSTIFAGPNSRFTSIGAYHDTAITVYERSGYAVAYYIQYGASYNGGNTWFYYNLTDTTTAACCPDVAARDNGGEGIAYAYGTSGSRRFRYTWRDYHGSWSTPVQFGDYQPPNNIKPAIEYLGNGVYGCIYVSYSPIYGAAYFDRNDWTGIAENETYSAKSDKIKISPNPSNGITNIYFSIKKTGNVKLSLYDISGRMVRNIINEIKLSGSHIINLNEKELPGGIYLVKMETPEGTFAKTITIIKK
ncbi:MAG: T9SS type A sorting domain-containing protein [candidate division WOR-3 bacterium]